MQHIRLSHTILFFSLLLNGALLFRQYYSTPQLDEHLQIAATAKLNAEPADEKTGEASLSAADLDTLFEAGDIQAALQGYIWLNKHKPEAARQLKAIWLERLNGWIKNTEQLDKAEKFILKARALQPEDDNFLTVQLDYLLAVNQPMAAIDVLYERIHSVSPARQGYYVSRLQKLLKLVAEKLAADQAWQQLIDLGQHLLWYEPQHPPYALLTARAYMQRENYAAATPLLQSIRYDEHYGEKAQSLLEQIALLDLQRDSIALTPKGAHYLVDGVLNHYYPIRLMIDTGASMSVISSEALSALDIAPPPEFVREAQINTAGGRVKAPIYRFERFAIENYTLSNVEFVVMPLQQGGGSVGLLGMNFLSKFTFRIDQKNNLLVLEPQ